MILPHTKGWLIKIDCLLRTLAKGCHRILWKSNWKRQVSKKTHKKWHQTHKKFAPANGMIKLQCVVYSRVPLERVPTVRQFLVLPTSLSCQSIIGPINVEFRDSVERLFDDLKVDWGMTFWCHSVSLRCIGIPLAKSIVLISYNKQWILHLYWKWPLGLAFDDFLAFHFPAILTFIPI